MTILHDLQQHTFADEPPQASPKKRGRPSKWAALLEECRQDRGVWRRTKQSFTPETAAQLASDIRSTWRRPGPKFRLAGLQAGERWETVCGPVTGSPHREQCFIWLRFISSANDDGDRLQRSEEPVVEYAW
jgi:hypothetical protein